MTTEEEAREPADGEEVQLEAVSLETADAHMHLDGKLSSNKGVKDEREIMDANEETLNSTEDQVLEEPSVVKTPPEHTSNGTISSLNGHMVERKISNRKTQENEKDEEQLEVSPDVTSINQGNKSNGEDAINSLDHGKRSTEDTSLLKHENEEPKEHDQSDLEGNVMDDKMVHEDTLKTDNDVEPTIDAQHDQNLESAKASENTTSASKTCIPDEVVTEELGGVQTALEPNVDDSDVLQDTSSGNPETIEPAKLDKESFREDENIAEHTYVVKLEDQQSKQTDEVGADMVHEETPKSNKTDLPEDLPKTEQADELTNDAQEVLQESHAEASSPVCEKTEETSRESSMVAYEDITMEHDATSREPTVDIQEPTVDIQEVQNHRSIEEITDAEEVDTEKPMQQNGVAFEEAIPEDHVATIEPSSYIQHVHNVDSEDIKGVEDAKAEETSNRSHAAFAEDAVQDKEALPSEPPTYVKPVKGLEQEETEDIGTVETDDASDQTHADIFSNLAEEDSVTGCEPQVTVLEVVKDIEATGTQDINHQSHAAASEEVVTKDNSTASEPTNDDIQQSLEQGSVEVTDAEVAEPDTQVICHESTISSAKDTVEYEEGPTCNAQEVQNVVTDEDIKDNMTDNIVEVPNVAEQEKNVLGNEDIAGQKIRELEPEEIKKTEPVVAEEASDQTHAAPFSDPAREDITTSEMPKTEPTQEAKETEATSTEANPQESNISISEEPTPEDNITASGTANDTCKVDTVKLAEDIEGNKDTRSEEISDKIDGAFDGETAKGINEHATEPTVDIQSGKNLESEKKSNTELVQVSEASYGMDAAVLENPSQEDSPTTSQLHVMESAGEVSNSGTTEGEATPHQSIVAQPEDQETEGSTASSEPQIREPESLEETKGIETTEHRELEETKNTEPVETQNNTTASNLPEVKDTEIMEIEAIHNDSTAANIAELTEDVKTSAVLADETAPDEYVPATESITDIPPEHEPEIKEIKDTEPVEVEDDTKASDLPSEDVKGDEAMRTEPIPHESTVASISVLTEDVKSNVVLADEPVIEATVDIPLVHEPEIEEINSIEPVEVEDNITESDLPAEEVKGTEAMETEPILCESTVASIREFTKDVQSNVALADEANLEEHVLTTEATIDIPPVQELALEEIKTKPVEVEDNIITRDLPAEEMQHSEAKETEADPHESTVASINELTENVKSNVVLTDEPVTEATVDVPPVHEPELEEINSIESVAVEDDITASDLLAEEVGTEAMEIEPILPESTVASIRELTEDVPSNVVLSDEPAPEVHVLAAEAVVDIPPVQEPAQEEINDTEPVDVEDNIIASDFPAQKMKVTEAKETEAIPHDNTVASISELTEDVKSNVVLADEPVTEATVDIPPVHEPELEEIKSIEPVVVEDNITASHLPAEEVKGTEAMETEPIIPESTVASIRELTENVQSNVVLADEAAEEHVLATEAVVDIPPVHKPALEEIKDTEPVEVEDNIIASDLPAEEMHDTEAEETKEIPHDNTVASISELTEDVKSNVVLTDEPVIEAIVDKSPVHEPEIEEINSIEPAEVEDNITASDLPAEEVKGTETMETEPIPREGTVASIGELSKYVQSNVSLADEAAPEEHVITNEATIDIPPMQEPTLVEIKDTEPVEVQDNIIASDLPAEEIQDNEAKETEAIPNMSNEDDILTVSAPLTDIQQAPVEESVEDQKYTDTTEYQGEPQQSTVSASDELTPTEEMTEVTEPTSNINVKNVTAREIEDTKDVETEKTLPAAEVVAQESVFLGSETTSDVEQVQEHDSTEETRGIEAVQNEDCQQYGVSTLEKSVPENIVTESEPNVDSQKVQEDKSAVEVGGIGDKEPEEISNQSNITTTKNAAKGSSELGSDTELFVPSAQQLELAEDGKGSQPAEEEKTGQSNATLEEPTAEDNASNEIDPPADVKQGHGLESLEGNRYIDDTEPEEASCTSQDAASEEPASTTGPTYDIQQASDLEEAKGIKENEVVTENCQKSEIAILEDPSPADNGTALKEHPVESNDENLVNKTDNVTLVNEKIKDEIQELTEQKAAQDVAEKDDTVKSGKHTDDQDNEQLRDMVLQMQVCERSVDAFAIEQEDEAAQNVNLDQQQKEDDEIEKKTKEIQTDEKKHDNNSADFTPETLLDHQCIQIGTTNMKEVDDTVKAEQTETVATQMINNEQTLHKLQESIPGIRDMDVENSTEIKDGTEEENEPNNSGSLHADAKNYKEYEKENAEKDATVAKTSVVDGTTDAIINEEIGDGLESSREEDLQNKSDPAHSDEGMQENVEDGKLAITENNAVEGEDIKQTREDQEASNADDDVQLEPEKVALDIISETDSNEKTEAVKFDEAICDKASEADGALSDETFGTSQETRRNLDASPVVTVSEGESMNEDKEHHKLPLPAQPTLDRKTSEHASTLEETERELSLPEKTLHAEPEEQKEMQITNEEDEENIHEHKVDETQNEAKEAEENYLPVSHFLMNLIMGKESNDPDEKLEVEDEKKQEETTEDGSSITCQQEEGLVSKPTENKVDDILIFKQEKQNLKGSEETHGLKVETDEELGQNTHDLQASVNQHHGQDKISSEPITGEASGQVTEMKTRDFELGEKAVDSISQQHMEETTQIEEGSLKRNIDESTSSKTSSQENSLEEERTELLHESSPEDGSSDAMAEKSVLSTEPDKGDENEVPNKTNDLQSSPSTKQEELTESSMTEAETTLEVQPENEVYKEEENHHSTSGGAIEEQLENVHAILQNGTGSEVISDEQIPEIIEPVTSTEKNLVANSLALREPVLKEENVRRTVANHEKIEGTKSNEEQEAFNSQVQEHDLDVISPKEAPEVRETLVGKPKLSTDEEQSPKKDESNMIEEKTYNGNTMDEAETKGSTDEAIIRTEENLIQKASHHQERDVDVVLTKEAPETEENFVHITKPEFSTDEEQSPKKDDSNMAEDTSYDEKIKDDKEAKNFTDEAATKIEEQEAGLKTLTKKHNILSGVGSKVKHQLAKVKKAIIGKPAHAKSESPKS